MQLKPGANILGSSTVEEARHWDILGLTSTTPTVARLTRKKSCYDRGGGGTVPVLGFLVSWRKETPCTSN